MLPLSGGEMRVDFVIPGHPPPARDGDAPIASMRYVSAGYFQTMGIRLASGRELASTDTAGTAPVVVINEALARRYWPGQEPVGRKVEVEMKEATIVGIVDDIHHAGPAHAPAPEMYLPYTQFPPRGGWIVIRTAGDPAALATALRSAVRDVDPNLPLSSVAPMSSLVERSVAQPRFLAALLGGFALLAVVLTLFGIYSVLSFAVSRRTREIGVRMALGAERRSVVGLVLSESVTRVAAGIAAGTVVAVALAQFLRTLLFGVGPADPATYLSMAGLIALAALAASYIPARRAAMVDPLVALRED
jgi:putative ABC transport system permease protein